jgi:hypothetical protein
VTTSRESDGNGSRLGALCSPDSSDLITVRRMDRTILVHWAGVKDKPEHRHLFVVGTMPHKPLCDHDPVEIIHLEVPTEGSLPCISCVLSATKSADVDEHIERTSESFRREVAPQDVDWLHPALRSKGQQDVTQDNLDWLTGLLGARVREPPMT